MRRSFGGRMRRYAITTVIALVPLAIMCAYVSNLLVPTQPLPRALPAVPVPPPAAYDIALTTAISNTSSTVGIADSDLYAMSNDDIIKSLDEMQSLGVNTVRVLIPWSGIQPYDPSLPPALGGGYFDWSKTDFIINQAASRGMGILGVINSTPYWGGANGMGFPGFPGFAPDPTKFATFSALVAQRYAGKVSAYEVWNEPNYFGNWLMGPDAAAYTQVLKQAYTAIKGADPSAMVVGGVLGAIYSFGGATIDPVSFVQQMYADGAKGYFDALSYHPYNYDGEFSDLQLNSPLNALIMIRQLMIDNGDASLRIWATEYGLGTSVVSEQQQAAWIKDFLDTWENIDYAGPAFIYTLRDRLDSTTEEGSMGLFYYDWTPKLAALIVKQAIATTAPPDPFKQTLRIVYQQFIGALGVAAVLADSSLHYMAIAWANLLAGILAPPPATTTTTTTATTAKLAAATATVEPATATAAGTTAAAQTAAGATADAGKKTDGQSTTAEAEATKTASTTAPATTEATVKQGVPAAEGTAAASATPVTTAPAAPSTSVPTQATSGQQAPATDAKPSDNTAASPATKPGGDKGSTDPQKKPGDQKHDDGSAASGKRSNDAGKNASSVVEIKGRAGEDAAKTDTSATASSSTASSSSSAS